MVSRISAIRSSLLWENYHSFGTEVKVGYAYPWNDRKLGCWVLSHHPLAALVRDTEVLIFVWFSETENQTRHTVCLLQKFGASEFPKPTKQTNMESCRGFLLGKRGTVEHIIFLEDSRRDERFYRIVVSRFDRKTGNLSVLRASSEQSERVVNTECGK
ncbi:MAG: hypothetical protein JRI47_08755 [Deltaproteobacteria bacterium]|nr:hypothetical protein [Deltaproteobacteria bacterium]